MADRRLIPPGIDDISSRAYEEQIARMLDALHVDRRKLLVYLIDRVESSALIHLAEQFHILGNEGWNFATTDTARRSVVKGAILSHRTRGTPVSVERAILMLGYTAEISEWFAYGGDPYRFRVSVDVSAGISSVTTGILWEIICQYKSARSYLDRLIMNLRLVSPVPQWAAAYAHGVLLTVYPNPGAGGGGDTMQTENGDTLQTETGDNLIT